MIKRSECDHPAEARKEALLHEPDEATVCTACWTMVFADGHTEPIGITKMTTVKRR